MVNNYKQTDISFGQEVVATLIVTSSKSQPVALHHNRSGVTTYYTNTPTVAQVLKDCVMDLTKLEQALIKQHYQQQPQH